MNNKNQTLNEQRRRQTQFLELVVELGSVDGARHQLNVSNAEMFRWMQGEAFQARYDNVVRTIEQLAEMQLRVARAQAVRHLAEVAAGRVEETTPAQQQQACNTLVREGRLVARRPIRHDRPRSASTPPPPPNRYAQIHPSIKEPEKSRLWAALQKDVRRAWEMNNDTSTTIVNNTTEPRRTSHPAHQPRSARELGEDVPRPADADLSHV